MEFIIEYILLPSVNCYTSLLSAKFITNLCMPVYIIFFFSRTVEMLTSVPLEEENKEGGVENSLIPKEEEQCLFIWFFSLPSTSNCHGVF